MIERREFIKKSVIGTAGIAIGGIGFSAKSYASIIGANERINLAVIGIRNQGTVHINSFCGLKDSHNVVVKTLCDTDELLFEPASKIVTQKTGIKPLTEWDIHKVLDDKDIHAVSIVTPNHWHALATVWACQAGKHVYVEKPASHNIWEGRKMVEAARKYNLRVSSRL
ncbi:Gfo/Idh/MocA family protein [Planctomycetota bacterium]